MKQCLLSVLWGTVHTTSGVSEGIGEMHQISLWETTKCGLIPFGVSEDRRSGGSGLPARYPRRPPTSCVPAHQHHSLPMQEHVVWLCLLVAHIFCSDNEAFWIIIQYLDDLKEAVGFPGHAVFPGQTGGASEIVM